MNKTKTYKPVSFNISGTATTTTTRPSALYKSPPKTLPKTTPRFVAPPPPSASFDPVPSTNRAATFVSPQKPVSPIQRSSVFDTPPSFERQASSSTPCITASANQQPARYRPITSADLNSLRQTPPSPKITRPSYMPITSTTSLMSPTESSRQSPRIADSSSTSTANAYSPIIRPATNHLNSPQSNHSTNQIPSQRRNAALSTLRIQKSPAVSIPRQPVTNQNASNQSPTTNGMYSIHCVHCTP